MKDCTFYIDEIKRVQGVNSDYAVAKLLGIRRQMMTQYHQGQSTFDSEMAFKVSELSRHPVMEIIAAMKAYKASRAGERSAARIWTALAKKASGGIAASVILTLPIIVASLAYAPDSSAKTVAGKSLFQLYQTIHYAQLLLALLVAWRRDGSRKIHALFMGAITSDRYNPANKNNKGLCYV